MAKGGDMQGRLAEFSAEVLNLTETLPGRGASRHVAEHLVRTASGGAPNYAEAWSGESLRDFHEVMGECQQPWAPGNRKARGVLGLFAEGTLAADSRTIGWGTNT